MCTTPNETCLRSFFLKVFFLPFFSGAAAAPPAAAGFAMENRPWSSVVSRWQIPCQRLLTKLASLLHHSSNISPQRWCRPTTDDQRPTTVLSLCRRLLLLRDRALARSLARPGVSMCPLSA